MKWLSYVCIGLLVVAGDGLAQSYIISTVAGSDRLRDGGPALAAPLRGPSAVVTDNAGNLYIADGPDYRIRKVAPSGTITTYVGVGLAVYVGDGGSANQAGIDEVGGMATDAAGNLYVADSGNCRVRKVSPSGVITTVAGTGKCLYGGDGGPATSAQLAPIAVAVDASGSLYIADMLNFRIRKVDTGGRITTIAGTGTAGYTGDGGPATSAQIHMLTGIAVDGAGNVYFTDWWNNRIRKVSTAGTITTIAGSGGYKYAGDGGPATMAQFDPAGIAVDSAGNLYIADSSNSRIRKITAATGVISTVAGNGVYGLGGDGGPATAAMLAHPTFVSIDAAGNLYIADTCGARVRKVAVDGTISTVAGAPVGDGGPATSAFLNRPDAVAVDASGALYIADAQHHRIRRVPPAGTISTFAGRGLHGFDEGGGQASQALLDSPAGVAVDATGNLYIADSDNYRIRKVTPAGIISTFAGTGTRGLAGDGGPATAAQIGEPTSVAVDVAGNVYFTDITANRIRKVTPSGTISTIAGNGNRTFAGDGGPATLAQLHPFDIALDRAGNLYVADRNNHRIRKIDAAGVITTVAGTGTAGFGGDGRSATTAQLDSPTGVAVDASDNLYIADYDNFVVRRVTPAGVISTVAGNRRMQYAGDGGPALLAGFDPYRVAVDRSGNVFVVDWFNDRIRKLTPQMPASMSVTGGNNQTGTAGQQLPIPLTVKVVDSAGNPVAGVTVNFAVTAGGATLSPATAVTGSDGVASTTVILGSTAGTVTVTATVSGLTAAVFNLTATAAAPTPRISAGGVVGAGLSVPPVRALSPNGILSVFGENFAPAGTFKQVTAADLVDGKVPTNFAGVCVMVGGVRAPIFLVKPDQINFQAPQLPASGAVQVQVVTDCGGANEVRSSGEPLPIQPAAPEFLYFRYSLDGKNPIAAANAVTGVYVGAPGLLPGATFLPAKGGDVLTLYLTGLGLTTPAFAPGALPDRAAPVTGAVEVRLGQVTLAPADVLYVGVTPMNPGLYQLNLRVPGNVPAGDQPVVISIGGIASPGGGFITIQQ